MQRQPYSPDGLDAWLGTLQVAVLYAAYTQQDDARCYWVQNGFNRAILFHGAGNRYRFGEQWIRPAAGDLLLIPANTRVLVELAEGHTERFVAFSLGVAPGGDLMNLLEHPRLLIPAADCGDAPAQIDRLVRAYQSPSLSARLGGVATVLELAQHWLGDLDGDWLARRKGQFDRLEPALRLIEQDFAQPLVLEDLAATTGLSAKYFCNHFSDVMGIGPVAYLAQRRLEYAAWLLLADDSRIREIAAAVGYADPYHFSRAFKRHHGRSPRAWRQQGGRDLLT